MTTTAGLLSARFPDAFTYAAQLHQRQVRKGGGTPYLAHLMAVSALVLEHGGTEDEAIAALLHDAIEDQAEHQDGPAALRAEIARRYGAAVAAIVDHCTDSDAVPKPAWRQRKECSLRHIVETPCPAYHRVSIADKLHNARAMLLDYRTHGDALWQRFNRREPADHLWYYRGLADAFRTAGQAPPALIDELERVVSAFEALVGRSTGV
jgi:GTP pyrophosphokinase